MILGSTGHRPQKLLRYWSRDKNLLLSRLTDLAVAVLSHQQPDKVVCGVALGWEMALALAALKLKIDLIVALPCLDQSARWNKKQQRTYDSILDQATIGYNPPIPCSSKAMYPRNRWIVDHCSYFIILWNGESNGGTFQTLNYAKQKGKRVTNVWNSWMKYKDN